MKPKHTTSIPAANSAQPRRSELTLINRSRPGYLLPPPPKNELLPASRFHGRSACRATIRSYLSPMLPVAMSNRGLPPAYTVPCGSPYLLRPCAVIQASMAAFSDSAGHSDGDGARVESLTKNRASRRRGLKLSNRTMAKSKGSCTNCILWHVCTKHTIAWIGER